MWKRTSLALLTAAALAGSALQPAAAQGGYYGGYDYRYDNRNRDPYAGNRYDYNNDYPYRDRYGDGRYAYGQDGYSYERCQQQRRGNTAGGAIIGAIAGGLFGNAISRGPQRGAGTALGALAGGALGAAVGSKLSCEDQRYAQQAYYTGFESGRPNRRYDWRGPRGDVYGYLNVGNYYRDRYGNRCATYTQEIYVNGRPEVGEGYACRQPDGTWQLIG